MNNKGSTMVLLVIVIALVLVLVTSVLSVAVDQYAIKRFNIDSKQCFYISETGLNEVYVRSCVLVDESIAEALQMAEEHLLIYPLNLTEAESIFITNYMSLLRTNIKDRIETAANPSVEIWNNSLVFNNNILTIILKSSYMHENDIDKITWVELLIIVPDFNGVADGEYDVGSYIILQNWNKVRI